MLSNAYDEAEADAGHRNEHMPTRVAIKSKMPSI